MLIAGKRILVCIAVLLAIRSASNAQVAPGKYWVRFSDKSHTPYSLATPEQFLSSKSIERRLRSGLGFNWYDLPIDPGYINSVLNLGNCALHNRSKWFNAITISVIDTSLTEELLSSLNQLPFVNEVRKVAALASAGNDVSEGKWKVLTGDDPAAITEDLAHQYKDGSFFSYGPSYRQIEMINGHLLHQEGYTGEGIDIAILDGGWAFTDLLPAFEKVRAEGRIVDTHDFVSPQFPTIYGASLHGTFVLSHICGIIEDSLVGTAPDARFYLYRTEDVSSEYLIEEDNWVAAAERCDSIGIDIINSSLGYSVFNDSLMNHQYEEMDGSSTYVSIAAERAASKGILVVNSAGNEGSSDWHYITAPSDGDHVLCVGAVDSNGIHAPFSSYGPSADGDVKPNVMAMGQSTVYADIDSTIGKGSGTSFSAPVMAGAAACLWEAFPLFSNFDIFRAIELSASLYATPNDSMGYGIPDMWKAYEILKEKTEKPLGDNDVVIFPNPATHVINVRIRNEEVEGIRYKVTDLSGRLVYSPAIATGADMGPVVNVSIDLNSLASGWYILRVYMNEQEYSLPFEKVNR